MAELIEKLEVKNLSHSFGFKEILKNISFVLNKGETLSVLGPSGAGKTTLLHLCSNLIEHEDGKIFNTFKTCSFAFQEPRLLPWKNTIDNIALGLRAKGINRKIAYEKSCKIAIDFGLEEDDFDKFPKDLSGGMKQRVSFARALVVEPNLLFLDEPFSALDIGLKKELKTKLLRICQKNNMSILFITHDPMEALALSDKIILLDSDPGVIAKTFEISTPKNQRDEIFAYNQMANFLKDDIVKKVFELDKI